MADIQNKRTTRNRLMLPLLLIALVGIVGVVVLIVSNRTTTSPSQQHVPSTYLVSLGDSVAAGDGLPLSNSSNSAACGQSDEAYPFLVAQAKNLTLKQFACSGALATTGILESQMVAKQNIAPQLAAAKPYLKDSDVIITIGANDVNWNSVLYSCATSNCATATNLATFEQGLGQLSTNLDTIAQTISSSHPKKVLFNTYYPLLKDSDTCLASRGITTAKIAWVNAREGELNSTITAAAQKYGYQSVAINFSGHLLCDDTPWIQGLTGSAPLHPTAIGQVGIADQDESAL